MDEDDLEQIARKICTRRRLRFLQRVGEGAFKQTFQVVDQDGVPAALKVYKSTGSNKRDHREISAMLRCKHPNIARLISVETYAYQSRKYIAITEEFLSGGTLASKGQISGTQCLQMGIQLIDGLAHIADLNLVHRDIKPDNIMFRSDASTPVITDFGLVRDLSDSSMTPTWASRGPGTPFFASPEQLNNEKDMIDWRTDQFSLGVTLSYVTLGDHPYRSVGLSDRDVVDRVSSRDEVCGWSIQRASSLGLGSLSRMIAPWSVDRYRKPEFLQNAWRQQKGTK
jgi:serine/threonine protein kinase